MIIFLFRREASKDYRYRHCERIDAILLRPKLCCGHAGDHCANYQAWMFERHRSQGLKLPLSPEKDREARHKACLVRVTTSRSSKLDYNTYILTTPNISNSMAKRLGGFWDEEAGILFVYGSGQGVACTKIWCLIQEVVDWI